MNHARAIDNLKALIDASNGIPLWRSNGRMTLSAGSEGVPTELLSSLELDGIYTEYDSSLRRHPILPAGTSIELQYSSQVERIVIAQNLAHMLQLQKAWEREPEAYIIWEKSVPIFYRRGMSLDSIPEPLKSYHQAIKLWSLLQAHAHHQDSDSSNLCYFSLRKIEIYPGFKAADLENPVDVTAIEKFMTENDASETRKDIFASRIAAHLGDQDPETRFSYLLHSVNRFARGLKEAMNIYLCEHSPEKLAEEAKKSAIDFTEKLEKIVSGLEAKTLTVPVAILLAYKEVKIGAAEDFFHNLMILISAVLYLIAMTWVWFTQAPLLDLLYKAMKEKEADLNKKGLDSSNPILTETFNTLKTRALHSEKFAGGMLICSFFPVAAVIIRWYFS